MKLVILLGITGLMLDIMGAWFISKGLVKKKLDDIRQEAPGFSYATNEAYIISVLTQKIEATMGFALLALGFMLQALVYGLNDFYLIVWNGYAVISFIGLVVLWILSSFIISRRVRTARKITLHEQLLRNGHPLDKPMHIEDTKRYLRYLKINHDTEIRIEEAWPLLLKNLGMI